jgi:protein tyrosine/serine phosphatase
MGRRTGLRGDQTGSAAAAVAADPRDFARRIPDAQGVAYAALVAPGLYRGGQPTEKGVGWLKQQGMRTVINLRHFHGETERQWVEAAGMHYERIDLASSNAPKAAQVARFLELVRDPGLFPIYVHCLHGVDRTGVMMVVYRMEVAGWSNARAIAEMDHFGPHVIWRDLRRFVRRYRPRAPALPEE